MEMQAEGLSAIDWRRWAPFGLLALLVLLLAARLDGRLGEAQTELASLREDVAALHKQTVEVRKRADATDLKLSNRNATRSAEVERDRAAAMERRAAQQEDKEAKERRAKIREAREPRDPGQEGRRELPNRRTRGSGGTPQGRSGKAGR
jgi:chromosome segregation ATPase